MDLRLMQSYEKIEQLRWNISETITVLEMAIQSNDASEQDLGNAICLCLRDLKKTACELEEQVKVLQKLNGISNDL